MTRIHDENERLVIDRSDHETLEKCWQTRRDIIDGSSICATAKTIKIRFKRDPSKETVFVGIMRA